MISSFTELLTYRRIYATLSARVQISLGKGFMKEQQGRTLSIKRVRDEAREIRSFDMLPLDCAGAHDLTFRPGQVAVLHVAGEYPAYFAYASAPDDPELEFLVKRAQGASARIFEMKEGDRVELTETVGQGFPLDEQRGKDLVFVAMGTGVAPLRSALRHVLKRKDEFGQLVVLYGARTPDDFCYRDETEGWEAEGVELRQVISRPDGHDWSGPTGYVQSLLEHVLPDLNSPVALICGSREMLEQTRERLQLLGFKPEEILTNY
jgi:sulfhydrogenase subunit gamma (sulfur reductase)